MKPLSPETKFVMTLPGDLPVKDVIARAKKAGHKVTARQVAGIRQRMKRRNGGLVKAPVTSTLSKEESELMALIISLGLQRTAHVLEVLQATIEPLRGNDSERG